MPFQNLVNPMVPCKLRFEQNRNQIAINWHSAHRKAVFKAIFNRHGKRLNSERLSITVELYGRLLDVFAVSYLQTHINSLGSVMLFALLWPIYIWKHDHLYHEQQWQQPRTLHSSHYTVKMNLSIILSPSSPSLLCFIRLVHSFTRLMHFSNKSQLGNWFTMHFVKMHVMDIRFSS